MRGYLICLEKYFASVVFEIPKESMQKPNIFHTYTSFEVSKSG